MKIFFVQTRSVACLTSVTTSNSFLALYRSLTWRRCRPAPAAPPQLVCLPLCPPRLSFSLPPSLNLRLVTAPSCFSQKKRKWESSKSHNLLQHPCLPTHNAVLRFVQLPRSLLVCMYTSTPPAAPHLLLIAQQKAASCRYFG